ncbi:hypothetical protein SLEP1_g21040 [Rubroshorea leprosula]|uniref:Uncharacterized protein n=1 Tax=Rubroshorea leprosula TaxID=152421 RepID=A0AAV5JAR2_9ROSI|nr:hypothetical protein SLEP1_g21036 [Rubroshorea leprosula]GKV09556.1 hypothetical protein SLEP1_g21040 [Rubroshorea leprosula]
MLGRELLIINFRYMMLISISYPSCKYAYPPRHWKRLSALFCLDDFVVYGATQFHAPIRYGRNSLT